MVPEVRRAWNAGFTPAKYQALLAGLESAVGFPPGFRISETPVFLTAELSAELERAAWEVFSAVTSESYLAAAGRAVPPGLAVPNEDPHPVFLQVDFALASGAGGEVVPRLIELQGFPSLYGFQWLLDREFREHFDVPPGWTPYSSGLDEASYATCLKDVIVGDADPETVVLLEVDPDHQKTRIDFVVTEQLTGVSTVDPAAVVERDGRLWYRHGGRDVPIRRLYNRVIFDELERKGKRFDHLFRRDVRELGAEWVGHPNWFLKISKFSLPFIRSRYAPPAWFLSDVTEYPDDLESWVLKPLFSFAGLGVELGPSPERLRSIERPENFILQRKVDYAPLVETPDGPAKAEVRMMFVWTDRPRLINNLVRMSKGAMMGVDFNRDKTWIGASLAYHPVLPATTASDR